MSLQSIPGALLSSTLKIIRVPLDGTLRLGGDSTEAARVMVDRADAGIREAAGLFLRDEGLAEDADRRKAAADERRHALRLKSEAQYRADRGDAAVETARDEAQKLRRNADRSARQQKQRAGKRRVAKTAEASKASRRRTQGAERTAQNRKQAVAERNKPERLAAVEKRSEALDAKQSALTASEEARRLNEAASGVKAKRRSATR